MFCALKNILAAIVGIAFCWLPVMVAFGSTMAGSGSFLDCLSREWGLWWSTYKDIRD